MRDWKGVETITFVYIFTALWMRPNNVIIVFDAECKINLPSIICMCSTDQVFKVPMFPQTISVICIKIG